MRRCPAFAAGRAYLDPAGRAVSGASAVDQGADLSYGSLSHLRPGAVRMVPDGVYFGAFGGAGALLAKCIKKAELIAYEDLGAEALRKLYVEDMPLVVIIDSEGNNLYEEGRAEYLKDHVE